MRKNFFAVLIGIVQSISACGIIVSIILSAPRVFTCVLTGVVCAVNIFLFFSYHHRYEKKCAGIEKVVFAELHADGFESDKNAVAVLERHMNACHASRVGTKKLINEGKEYSLSFTQQMKDSIYTATRINGSVHTINERIEYLNEEILGSMSAIEQITQTIMSFEHQIETQSEAVVQTSAAIEEMDASIRNVSTITEKKQDASAHLVNLTKESSVHMEELGKAIEAINSNIGSVQEINQMIDGIASQTNLLSMNAAIEAAHAGDAGKGFAVVADEIRKLSESTAQNAKLISKTLKDIVGNIKNIQNSSSVSLKNSVNITQESENMAEAFREIKMAASELSEGSSEIVNATQNLKNITTSIKSGSGEISESSEHIGKSIQQVVNASKESSDETKQIADVAQNLNMAFLGISDVFLKYEDAVTRIQKFQDAEFSEKSRGTDFDAVPIIIQHLLWIIRVRGVMDGKLQVNVSTLGDHKSCQLGKWIDGKEADRFRNSGNFRQMVSDHEKMHSLVRSIIAAAGDRDPKALEVKFDELLDYSAKIITAITELAGELKKG